LRWYPRRTEIRTKIVSITRPKMISWGLSGSSTVNWCIMQSTDKPSIVNNVIRNPKKEA
jgi:hypothetical protein